MTKKTCTDSGDWLVVPEDPKPPTHKNENSTNLLIEINFFTLNDWTSSARFSRMAPIMSNLSNPHRSNSSVWSSSEDLLELSISTMVTANSDADIPRGFSSPYTDLMVFSNQSIETLLAAGVSDLALA